MVTLRAAAVEKARVGETTFEEALRVTHSDHASAESCPSCARAVARDMVACPYCATALDRGRCRSCSRQLDPDWRICPWCRTPAPPSGSSSSAAAVPGAAPSPAPPMQASPAEPLYSGVRSHPAG
jgi:type IV pilus assembly protein PilB